MTHGERVMSGSKFWDPLKRNPVMKIAIALGFGLVVVASVLGARRTATSSSAGTHPSASRDAPFLDGDLIRFSDAFAQRAGVSVVTVTAKDLEPIITVTGDVTFNPHQFAAVGARISGRVRRVLKRVGDEALPQMILAEIESAELGRTEALLLGTRAKEIAAEADMKRERQLAASHISSEREAEMATAHYEAAHAERLASEHAVKALGGEMGGQIGILFIRSPIAGKVVSSKISRGQTVEPTDTVYEIADLSSVWVELNVFERDLRVVRAGDSVEISTQFAPDKPLPGEVAQVGDIVDPKTRSAPVRVVVDNPGNALRPGQSVNARIHTAASAGKMLIVPRAAVTRVDGKPTVFVMRKQAAEPRAVELGPADRENVGILTGLAEGEEVVVGGLLELKSEIFR